MLHIYDVNRYGNDSYYAVNNESNNDSPDSCWNPIHRGENFSCNHPHISAIRNPNPVIGLVDSTVPFLLNQREMMKH